MNRLLRFSAFFIGPVLLSTVVCDGRCHDIKPYRYQIERYDPVPRRSIDRNLYDPGTPIPTVYSLTNGDSVLYKTLEIGFPGKAVMVSRSVGRGGSALYVCSPAEIPAGRISPLTIVSDQAYNARFRAGDESKRIDGDWSQFAQPTAIGSVPEQCAANRRFLPYATLHQTY